MGTLHASFDPTPYSTKFTRLRMGQRPILLQGMHRTSALVGAIPGWAVSGKHVQAHNAHHQSVFPIYYFTHRHGIVSRPI